MARPLLALLALAVSSALVTPLVAQGPAAPKAAKAPAPAAKAGNSLLDKSGNPAGFVTLEIGAPAPDFALPNVDGKTYTLSDFAGPEVLVVLFTSNHCPTSHGIEGRLSKFRQDYRSKGVGMLAINPNHPEGLSADELGYGEYSDSFEEMKPYYQKLGWDFPYLYDGDKQLTARAYGCLATPHVFIFDKERKLRYAGAFDDSRYEQEETVKKHYARDAVDALLAGKPIAVERTKPFGCSTKWREKRQSHVAKEDSWTKIPVAIEQTDAAGVAALRANPTGKYRLFNVWATWCTPCVEEFPALVAISRKFGLRDFELVTISMDDPKHQAKAQTFLQKQGAGIVKRLQDTIDKEGRKTNHYLFNGADQGALVSALDPEWPGPIPHTVLVGPGGTILWRHNGMITQDEAISEILKVMGNHYQPAPAPVKSGKTD